MFEYKQYVLGDMVETIKRELVEIDSIVEEDGQQEELTELMESTIMALELAQAVAHRLDWYISGDDSFDTYKQRLEEDIEKVLGDIK